MKLSDLRNLDRNNLGAWPQGAKLLLCGVLFALLLLAGWAWSIRDQQDTLEQKRGQEVQLKQDFHEKQVKVVNLEKLKQQLDDMREILHQLLRQLPSKTQMPELLIDISQAALSAGLETQLFQPGPETIKENFYAEKPISLRMLGTYHQFGSFISAVAALPRVVILTMHDVSLKPSAAGPKTGGELTLEGTVKTYRYVEEDEVDNKKAAPAQKTAAGAPAKGGQ
ncbi:MAG TPA: type 4a pilus biogenesis protein PilO [Rudaea sp.]|jgi:type IV pilus assembly protein PilO|uniref:type 4a pilus biogenesis protein PilO n=1 Tax=Rudaea sp. TaxID=2136325 RepID=UPI002F94E62A